MLRNYMGIINLEESEKDIRSLTNFRPIGTIPVAGRYRVIDFTLSNMVNAGLRHISVFCKKETRSLPDHLGAGRPWDLDRKNDGLFVFQHSLLGGDSSLDAKLFAHNMEFINRSNCEYAIVSSSYMIANVDLEAAAKAYEESGADICVIYKNIEDAKDNFLNCDLLKFDENNKVINVVKNIGGEEKAAVCAEMFILKTKTLQELMYKAITNGVRKGFNHFVYDNINSYNVVGYEFKGYLSCINSIESYYKMNMDMLKIEKVGELFNRNSPIYTKTKDAPPAVYCEESDVKNSIVADGTIVKGKIRDSIISRRVRIGKDVELEGCIVLQNAIIKDGVKLKNVIIDKGVTVEENTVIHGQKEYPIVLEKKR